jgi:hypothetical protein
MNKTVIATRAMAATTDGALVPDNAETSGAMLKIVARMMTTTPRESVPASTDPMNKRTNREAA